jgi:hypothetical protein
MGSPEGLPRDRPDFRPSWQCRKAVVLALGRQRHCGTSCATLSVSTCDVGRRSRACRKYRKYPKLPGVVQPMGETVEMRPPVASAGRP